MKYRLVTYSRSGFGLTQWKTTFYSIEKKNKYGWTPIYCTSIQDDADDLYGLLINQPKKTIRSISRNIRG